MILEYSRPHSHSLKSQRSTALDRIHALDDESLELRVKVPSKIEPIAIHSLFMTFITTSPYATEYEA